MTASLLTQALSAAFGDLIVGLILAAIIGFGLLVWHSKREKRRAEERGEVYVEEIVPAFSQWPAKKRVVAETHPREHERIAPMAGRRAA